MWCRYDVFRLINLYFYTSTLSQEGWWSGHTEKRWALRLLSGDKAEILPQADLWHFTFQPAIDERTLRAECCFRCRHANDRMWIRPSRMETCVADAEGYIQGFKHDYYCVLPLAVNGSLFVLDDGWFRDGHRLNGWCMELVSKRCSLFHQHSVH